MTIQADNLAWVCELVESRSGNVLDESKSYLVDARLAQLAKSQNVANVDELIAKLRSSPNRTLEGNVVEAMLTHETFFFRDAHYFDEIGRKILPSLLKKRESCKRLNIWCAASAGGQEPYSLAMVIHEEVGTLKDWTINLHATDLSRSMIAHAKTGEYTELEMQRGLSPQRQRRFLQPSGNRWKVVPAIQQMVNFSTLNLCSDSPPYREFDLILMRNVLIYLNDQSKDRILSRVAESLSDDGVLILGATETLYQHPGLFTRDDYRIPAYRLNR
jgi:chemotaxis protein methyltransferase CheR